MVVLLNFVTMSESCAQGQRKPDVEVSTFCYGYLHLAASIPAHHTDQPIFTRSRSPVTTPVTTHWMAAHVAGGDQSWTLHSSCFGHWSRHLALSGLERMTSSLFVGAAANCNSLPATKASRSQSQTVTTDDMQEKRRDTF
ncbi:hypothetical protein CONLIGDRAFT_179121 [Coniochaeta ligniaria NRRL 30616]|uniref:Uncharacterized protein n=1 Tax=Coniochaeta ligniaria NRRL 30616 TaxID=1408157 RepID=A0A1J7J081_9PEZI|nr:hypothetical protein CONLIGDRAFT_179121 [Coniochaeta ligniaria NRRL 30616]